MIEMIEEIGAERSMIGGREVGMEEVIAEIGGSEVWVVEHITKVSPMIANTIDSMIVTIGGIEKGSGVKIGGIEIGIEGTEAEIGGMWIRGRGQGVIPSRDPGDEGIEIGKDITTGAVMATEIGAGMDIETRRKVEVGPEDEGAEVGVLTGNIVCEVGVDLLRDLDLPMPGQSEEIEWREKSMSRRRIMDRVKEKRIRVTLVV